MEQETTIRATDADSGKRLDQFLTSALANVSRARVQQLIETGKILVEGEPAKPSLRLRGGEQINLLEPGARPPLRAFPEPIPLDVLYEDEDVAVVNKPAGMMVHAGAGATDDVRNRGTLVNALLHRFGTVSQVGGELRPGIVHRLDRATSGLMLVAKNDIAHRELAAQFSRRQVKKTYVALVHGAVQQDQGTIQSAISRDLQRRTRMTTRRREGRSATTHFQVRERLQTPWGKFSLLELRIETGRTHQIRVHLSSIGHPVVGDTLYGAPREIKAAANPKTSVSTRTSSLLKEQSLPVLGRNFLHACAVEFTHPRTGVLQSFRSDLPEELKAFLRQVRG